MPTQTESIEAKSPADEIRSKVSGLQLAKFDHARKGLETLSESYRLGEVRLFKNFLELVERHRAAIETALTRSHMTEHDARHEANRILGMYLSKKELDAAANEAGKQTENEELRIKARRAELKHKRESSISK